MYNLFVHQLFLTKGDIKLMEFDFIIIFTVILFILKLCGVAITWTQVFIPLFVLGFILFCATIGAVTICCKLIDKYGIFETQRIIDELSSLIKGLI